MSQVGEELFHAQRNITSTSEQFLPGMKDMMTTNHPTPIQLDCDGRRDVNLFSLSQLIRLANMKCDREVMRHRLLFIEFVRNVVRCCFRRCLIEFDLLYRDAPVPMRVRSEYLSRSTGRGGTQ